MDREDLRNQSYEQLQETAKNIPGIDQSASREELIDAIMRNQESGGSQGNY